MTQQNRAKRCPPPAALLAVASAFVAACGGDGGASGAGGGGSNPAGTSGRGSGGVAPIDLPYAPCPEGEAVGQFVIGLDVDEGYSYVAGEVSDGVTPDPSPDELARAGDCRLLRPVQTMCAPMCPFATERCNTEGACVALPRTHDVGTVTVQGLVIPMQMSPSPVRKYSNPAQPMLPNPGFLPGADLRIVTAGGDYGPFELRGFGVTPLMLGSDPIDVVAGRATSLRWQAPELPGPTRLQVQLNINFHGTTGAKIECEFADTGAGEIPATLIDGLIAQGLSGFPTLTAARRSATSVEIEPGCVELLVVSEVSTPVRVEGVTSCNTEMPCPEGQTCLTPELFCQ